MFSKQFFHTLHTQSRN